jgi:MFS family permease
MTAIASDDVQPADTSLPRVHAWAVAIVATLVMTVSYIDRQTLAAIAPTVCKALNIDNTAYGWIGSAFAIAYLVGAPTAGILVDRFGARRTLVSAVLMWSGIAAIHTLVPTFGMLIALRVALGLAEAPSFPGAAQTIRRVLPAGDRSAGFGLLFTGSSIGAMIAAPLAIWITARASPLALWITLRTPWRMASWRMAFIGTAIAGLLWVPLWIFATGNKRVRAAMSFKDVNASTPTNSASTLAILTNPVVIRAMILVVASAPAIMYVLNWLSKYLAFTYGVAQNDLGRYLWFPPLVFDLGAVGFGAIASRIDRKRVAAGEPHRAHRGLVLFGTILMTALALTPFVHDPMIATLLGAISLAGGGALYALLTADMMARIDASFVARAGGFCAAAQSLAQFVAAPLIGKVVDRTHSYTSILIGLAAFVVPGAIVWLVWPIDQKA